MSSHKAAISVILVTAAVAATLEASAGLPVGGIDWLGIGAFMTGLGSLLTGMAALKSAKGGDADEDAESGGAAGKRKPRARRKFRLSRGDRSGSGRGAGEDGHD